MLLNEFLKEHRTVHEQQKEIDTLKAELKEERALIQKVSAQLELSKPAPQTVLNDYLVSATIEAVKQPRTNHTPR